MIIKMVEKQPVCWRKRLFITTRLATVCCDRRLWLWLFVVCVVIAGIPRPATVFADDEIPPEQLEFFESHIRPVLIENCYACHNSVEKAEADFALDYRDGIRDMIDFEQPADSMLLQVVRHEIEDLEMPVGGAQLSPRAIQHLTQWINMGAPDPRKSPPTKEQFAAEQSWDATLQRRKQWWCFQPIENPPVPRPRASDWSAHPVDRFVLQELEKAGLVPSEQATRPTLLRRLAFALTGLPPSPEMVAEFTADPSPDAYEELVDRFLASEHFGERWSRHWMDWIRYAESHGSEGDPAIPHAYRYRDYLIRALNVDVPYDQLVREHLAGDLLPNGRVNEQLGINESALATAHWRMVFHGFAPTDALDEKVRFTDDQINAFSKAFLGLTVSCARCHDHKFDAISQADYYALFGILGSTRPHMQDVNTPSRQTMHRERLREFKDAIRDKIAKSWLRELETVERQLPKLEEPWAKAVAQARQHVAKAERVSDNQKNARVRWSLPSTEDYPAWFRDGNGLSERPAPAGEFTIALTGNEIVEQVLPAGVYSHTLSTKHRAVLSSPAISLDGEFDLWLRVAGDGGAMVRYAVQNYPRRGTVYPVTALNGGDWKWQRFPLKYWQGDEIHVELTTAADAPLLATGAGRSWFGVRDVVLTPSGEPGPRDSLDQPAIGLLDEFADGKQLSSEDFAKRYVTALKHCVVAWQQNRATDHQAIFLSQCLDAGLLPNQLAAIPDVADLVKKYRDLEREIPEPTRIVGLAEAGGSDQALFVRGNHKMPGDPVPRRFLEAIDSSPYQTRQSGRLELANDLFRSDNPLTARVIVNRLWHHLFGRGIVATPDNFGRLGELPTHPELLDYLANRMMRNGWSIKDMIRFLVTSKTWQQTSKPSEQALRIDPENRLLSHASVRRLEAEAIRDALLAVSGRIDLQMYGDSVGGNSPRRSVYVQVRRNSLDPFLRVFDFPEPFTCKGRRNATNVPAQSLTMMNDPFVDGLAGAWAGRVVAAEGVANVRERIDLMYRQAFGRAAEKDEIDGAVAYLDDFKTTSADLARNIAKLRDRIASQRSEIVRITEPVRERLLKARGSNDARPVDLQPIGRWEFDNDLHDSVGKAHGVAFGGARIENGALVVDGKSAHVVTAPIASDLSAKTLEAWVQLDRLDQRGGGVLTVQTPNGVTFDSIVFAERDPRQWLAGSNNFRRTQSFSGPAEAEAADEPVHLAIVYQADGSIAAYRNGQPYGKAYKSGGPQKFAAGQTTVAFGVRHLPAGGNRMLAGRILQASLYDRALSAEEVAASAGRNSGFVSQRELLAALPAADREKVRAAEMQIEALQSQLQQLGPVPAADDPATLWTELARAFFNFKEFIYLK